MTQQLVTLIPKDITKMNRGELKRELRCQKYLLRRCEKQRAYFEYIVENSDKTFEGREDKIQFFDNYVKNLEAVIAQIQWLMERRADAVPEGYTIHNMPPATRRARRKKTEERILHRVNDEMKKKRMKEAMGRDGVNFAWDRDKFFQVARDRGYMTEEGASYAVAKELGLDRARVMPLLRIGKFTWGQVLLIGALFEMTPKEFCDIFLAGYFKDEFGRYVATDENLDKSVLLQRLVLDNK